MRTGTPRAKSHRHCGEAKDFLLLRGLHNTAKVKEITIEPEIVGVPPLCLTQKRLRLTKGTFIPQKGKSQD
jgi:hypothetical protein